MLDAEWEPVSPPDVAEMDEAAVDPRVNQLGCVDKPSSYIEELKLDGGRVKAVQWQLHDFAGMGSLSSGPVVDYSCTSKQVKEAIEQVLR